jgi:hypothetical protein
MKRSDSSAFEFALQATRAALAALPNPDAFDIQEVSDVVFADICKHWFDIPDGEFVKAGGFHLSNLLSPGRCPGDYTRLPATSSIPTRTSC